MVHFYASNSWKITSVNLMAERVGFFPSKIGIFMNLGQIASNFMIARTLAIVY